MLKIDDTVLLVIDIQGKLAQLMFNKEELFKNVRLMIRGAQILEVPILLTEQYPQGLGPTVPVWLGRGHPRPRDWAASTAASTASSQRSQRR